MHEMSMAQSILEIVSRHAAGQRVTTVELKVGALRQVVPSALTFSFELISMGTSAEGAELRLDLIPAQGVCRACGATSRLPSFPLICESCGGFHLQIIAGEELTVESLELQEVESGTLSK
jgi:hydrogenase nickel incorporation protein HypA/HybF